jgi:anaerobic ribonucleoside-triphosphate reductase activating protein
MNIASTQYTLEIKSLEIYVAGCNASPHCPNCHNPESWNFNLGENYDFEYLLKLENKVKNFDNMIDNIMIMGGEPLDQNKKEIYELFFDIATSSTLNTKKIWLFTRYELENIAKEIKDLCDYIKCGKYIKELSCDNNIQHGIKLATSNQNIYKKGIDY